MIDEKGFRVLGSLDSPKDHQELADELDYHKSTISEALSDLEKLGLVQKEWKGNHVVAEPSDVRCVEVYQSLTQSHPHVDFPDLFTKSMVNVLYYLNADDGMAAWELQERTEYARATIYRNLRTLTNRAMATKEQSQYWLREEFEELHDFANELRHQIHRVKVKNDLGSGTLVWDSHDEFLVRTDDPVEELNYLPTGLDAFGEYDLRFFTTEEHYYFYSETRQSLDPADLICHLLLIENDSRHRKYALLLAADRRISKNHMRQVASYYGVEETVSALMEFLITEGEFESENTPRWEEFESLAKEYEVEI
jgi:predicted transcriptional regulator